MKKTLSLLAIFAFVLVGAGCSQIDVAEFCDKNPNSKECQAIGARTADAGIQKTMVSGNIVSQTDPDVAAFVPYADGGANLGSPSLYWDNIYGNTAFITALDTTECFEVTDSGQTATSTICATGTSSSTFNGWVVVGVAQPSHLSKAQGDTFVSGELEVDGATWFDNTISVLSAATFQSNVNLGDGDQFQFGSQPDSALDWSTSQTNDSLVWGLGDDSKSIVFTEFQWRNQSFDLGNFDYPSIVMTVGDPDFDNTRWGAFGFSSTTDALAFTSRSGAFAFNNQAATTTLHVTTTASGLGGAIILEDSDGAGCTEVTAKDGVGYFKTVDCTK